MDGWLVGWLDGLGVSRKAGRIRGRRGVRACDCERREGGREGVRESE